MFGKGFKRKLDEEEAAGLEGPAPAPPVAPGGAGPRGLEGPSKVSYTLQRQTIFNISLMKLMYGHRSSPAEPRLERRVLINNMLRRIQDELKQEGPPRPPLLLLPPDDPMDESFREAPPTAAALGTPPSSPPPSSPAPAPPAPSPRARPATPARPAPMEACLTPASLLEDVAPPTPPPTPPRRQPERTAAHAKTTSPPAPAPPGQARPCKDPKAEAVVEVRPADTPDAAPCPPAPSSPSGFLSDLALDDILFADIDTSMYDFDACTAAAAGAGKLSPAVTADDLLKSLGSPYAVAPAPQVSANQAFKMDLTELDHIMEVLVGS